MPLDPNEARLQQPVIRPSVTVDDLVALLRRRPGLCATEIGEALWGMANVNRQCYARPAGALAARAKREGRVRESWERSCGRLRRVFFCQITPKDQLAEVHEDFRREGEAAKVVDDLRRKLAAIRKALAEIVISEGQDAGVILLSDESPTHYDAETKCQVYDHDNFSPLGNALVSVARMAAVSVQSA